MRILLSMEEDANGSLLGKLFKSYLAYRVISYPFRKNKNQDSQTYYEDLEDEEDYYWEDE